MNGTSKTKNFSFQTHGKNADESAFFSFRGEGMMPAYGKGIEAK